MWIDPLKRAVTDFWQRTVLGGGAEMPPAPLLEANQTVGRYGLHQLFRYDQFDEETGLFFNDHSVSFCFDVLPQTGADEEMRRRLTTLFTPLPAGIGVQWCLAGTPLLDEAFAAYQHLRHQAVARGQTDPLFEDLAKRRTQAVRRSPGRPLWQGDNYTVKGLRLVFSITKSGSYRDPALVNEMAELKNTLQAALQSAMLPATLMDATALIRFLWPLLNPEVMFQAEAMPDVSYDPGKSIKEQLTAFGQHVKVTPHEMIWGVAPEEERDTRIAMRGFGVMHYPQKKALWEMAHVIGAAFDTGLHYPCPFVISGGMVTLDANTVESAAPLKAARAKQNAQSRMAMFQPELHLQAQDWDVVLHHLNQGGHLCELYHTLLIYSERPRLNSASQVALNIWKSQRFTLCPLQFLHLTSLVMSVPMTLTSALRDGLKKMRLITTKTTVNAVDMSPVIGEWRGAGEPVLSLYGRQGSPTFLDFYSNAQGNYNVFVTGVSGSGKSVFLNEIVCGYRGVGARVWIIDVGRSYRNLIALQNGVFLEFGGRRQICINPFSWVGLDPEIPFKEELNLLRPILCRMASPNERLTAFQIALIDEAISAVWAEHGRASNPTLVRDYLATCIKNERGEPERAAYELSKQLYPFTVDGIYGDYFNGEATLSLDHDMVGLELEELNQSPDLRSVVLLVLTSRIASEMYLMPRDRKKLLVLDEAWQLLGDDEETAKFIEEGYRRARKYNGIFCLGTQGIRDAFKNDASRAAWTNADWKCLLRQDPKELEATIKEGKVDFSPATKRLLLSLRTEAGKFSEILVSSPQGEAVVRHIPDPFSLMMASTKAQEFVECEALLKAGHTVMEALTIMLERRGYVA